MFGSIYRTVVMSVLIFALILRVLSLFWSSPPPVPPIPEPTTRPVTTAALSTTTAVTAPTTTAAATTAPAATTTTAPATTTTTAPAATTTTAPAATTTTAPAATTTTAPATTAPTTVPPTTEKIPPVLDASVVFKKTFGGNSDDVFRAVEAIPSGGFIACGTSSSSTGDFAGMVGAGWKAPWAFVAKFNDEGSALWTRILGDSEAGVTLEDVVVLPDGGFAAVGYTEAKKYAANPISKGSVDAVVVRFDANGNNMRVQSFGGSRTDLFFCAASTPSGLVAGGKTDSTDGDFDRFTSRGAILLKLADDGAVLWEKRLCGEKGGFYKDLSAGKNGEIFASCLTASKTGDFAAFNGLGKGSVDSIIIKYDASGNRIWDFVIASSGEDNFGAVAADGSGGCVAAGNYALTHLAATTDGSLAGVHNCGGIDSLIFKINASGSLTARQSAAGFYDDYITDVIKTDSGFVITGYTSSANRDFSQIGNLGGFDGFVGILDKDCLSVRILSQAGSGDDFADCAASKSGSVFVLGRTKSSDGDFSGSPPRKSSLGYIAKYKITAS